MNMIKKENYIAPECEEIHIRLEGCIALSGDVDPTYKGFNEEEEEW